MLYIISGCTILFLLSLSYYIDKKGENSSEKVKQILDEELTKTKENQRINGGIRDTF